MFTGSMVAIATPMNEDGSIDYASYENLIEFHINNSTDAIVPVGTTGESATIDNAEHCEIVSFVVDKVAKRIPVIAGTGANSTSEATALTKYCNDKIDQKAIMFLLNATYRKGDEPNFVVTSNLPSEKKFCVSLK